MTAPCKCIPQAGVPFFTCRHYAYFINGTYQRQVEVRYSVDANYSGAFGSGSTVGFHPGSKDEVLKFIHHEHSDEETI